MCACADESLAERGTCGMFAELSSVRKEIIEMERDLLWTFFSSPFLGGSKNVVCVCVWCVCGGGRGDSLSATKIRHRTPPSATGMQATRLARRDTIRSRYALFCRFFNYTKRAGGRGTESVQEVLQTK